MATAIAINKKRLFKGDFGTFESFLTPQGKQVSFYRGCLLTEDKEIAEFAASLPSVEEVPYKEGMEVPTPPQRQRNTNWASAAGSDPTQVSVAELLQRAVASSASTPQAAESTSTK